MLLAFAPPASAQTIDFPTAASDAAAAEAQFDERAEAIIQGNACLREPDYGKYRQEMAAGDYRNEGEGLLDLVIAKIAWLVEHEADQKPCEIKFTLPWKSTTARPTVEAATEEIGTFAGDKLREWSDPAKPTSCATGQVSAKLDPNDPAIGTLKISASIDHACLKRQVNEGIRAMTKVGRMGTDFPVPCVWGSSKGDYDMTVKELVRVMYMAGAVGSNPNNKILDAATLSHMYDKLLAARGELGDASFSLVSDCADTANESLGSPEDTADQEYFGNEVLDALGDVGEWLGNFFIKSALPALLIAVGGGAIAGLVAVAGLVLDPGAALTQPPFDVQIPETENHRLMIESSRYLTNAAIIAELKRIDHDNLDEILEQQGEVREWLLKRLQYIASHDFDEYNARPYTRLSLRAILNLYDFADDVGPTGDKAMRDAARIVLDLSSAKFAAASNRGRRVAPFRRLSENDGTDPEHRDPAKLYNTFSGADHEVVRAFVLSGQTQLLEKKWPKPDEWPIVPAMPTFIAGSMVQTAVSGYRLPREILEVIVERKLPFRQMIRNAGLEAYYASPAFTTSLGGVQTGSALGATIFNINPNGNDHGVAMPTSILPTVAGLHLDQVFTFRGVDRGEDRTENLCAWKGFICGLNPPAWVNTASAAGPSIWRDLGCTISAQSQDDGSLHYFLSSASCDALTGGPHFYLAAKIWPCHDGDEFCPEEARYGFMEAVEAPNASPNDELAFDRFKIERAAAMAAATPDRHGVAVYRSAAGDLIRFQISRERPVILAINGVSVPAFGRPAPAIDTYYLTRGGVLNSFGSKATIRSPWGNKRIDIDFSNWREPRITESPMPAGGTTEIYAVKLGDPDGALEYHKHLDAEGPAFTMTEGMAGPVRLGKFWDRYQTIVAAIGAPVIYAMEPDGDLFWYRHLGFQDGSDRWLGPKKVGTGWTSFDKIIAGEDGVLYGRLPDGSLRWHRHLDTKEGSVSWADAKIVGTGWNEFTDIFAGSSGVLYGVRPNGDLIWHKHLGHLDGTVSWSEPSRRVGTGWQDFRAVLSVGRGVIYAIKPSGELVWYRHLGQETGEDRSAESATIDTGWGNFKQVFALSPEEQGIP